MHTQQVYDIFRKNTGSYPNLLYRTISTKFGNYRSNVSFYVKASVTLRTSWAQLVIASGTRYDLSSGMEMGIKVHKREEGYR